MKRLTLGLAALVALGSAAFAGTETYSKETQAVVPPCPQWYADNEFNLSLSGVYAFSNNDPEFFSDLDLGNSWGGALEAKYFFRRYFGFGVQGFILATEKNDFNFAADDDDTEAVGGLLGTFTVRFPINCSRFAPYVWVGGGAMWGGSDGNFVVNPGGGSGGRENEQDARALGQVGGGFEIRFTPHIGLLSDFSWNVDSDSNSFGMARTGLNFAF